MFFVSKYVICQSCTMRRALNFLLDLGALRIDAAVPLSTACHGLYNDSHLAVAAQPNLRTVVLSSSVYYSR